MLQHVMLNLVLTFIVGRLAAASTDNTINWSQMLADWNANVLTLIPLKFLQGPAQAIGDSIITLFAKLLADKEDELALAQDLANKDWPDALGVAKRMVLDNWAPTDAAGKELHSLIFAGTVVSGAADHPTVVPVAGGPAGKVAAPAPVEHADTPVADAPSSDDKPGAA